MLPKRNPEEKDREVITSLADLAEITRPVNRTRLTEMRVTFWVAILLVLLGAAILIWGVLEREDIKSTKIVVGLFVNVLGAFVLKLHGHADDKLSEACQREEQNAQINRIEDPRERDRARLRYIESLSPKKGWLKRLLGL